MPDIPRDAGSVRSEAKLYQWQSRMLPLMVKMLLGLSLFFFLATMAQLFYLQQRIHTVPELDVKRTVDAPSGSGAPDPAGLDAVRWNTLSQLEAYCIQRRYHQANVLLMSRVWFGYLGFITGMICTFIGATLILGKFQEPATQVASEAAAWKISINTASPGLMLALLGTVLMITTMISPARIDVRDGPSFLNSWAAGEGGRPATPDEIVDNLNLTTHTNK